MTLALLQPLEHLLRHVLNIRNHLLHLACGRGLGNGDVGQLIARSAGNVRLDPSRIVVEVVQRDVVPAWRQVTEGESTIPVAIVISLAALVAAEWLARRAGMRFHGE